MYNGSFGIIDPGPTPRGVCGSDTPLACFSREIGNFSRQNGEATPRSTCITFGPQALIKITCKIKKRSFEAS